MKNFDWQKWLEDFKMQRQCLNKNCRTRKRFLGFWDRYQSNKKTSTGLKMHTNLFIASRSEIDSSKCYLKDK